MCNSALSTRSSSRVSGTLGTYVMFTLRNLCRYAVQFSSVHPSPCTSCSVLGCLTEPCDGLARLWASDTREMYCALPRAALCFTRYVCPIPFLSGLETSGYIR